MRSRARWSMSSAWSSAMAAAPVRSGDAIAGEAAIAREKTNAVSMVVLFMVSARLSIGGARDASRGARGDVFPLPQFVAHDPHFEEKGRRVDAAADVVEIRRADRRRTVHDVDQAAFEFVEHRDHRALADVRRVLTIQAARLQQIV